MDHFGEAGEAAERRPVFVVGMNGSGTTMMLNCLNAHSKLYGFPRETLILPYFIAKSRNYDLSVPEKLRELWDDFRSQSCFTWVNGGEAPPLPDYWAELAPGLPTVIDETFLYFARKNNKQRWCEKSPMYAQHIPALHRLFPHASFIHMIRDGRSCAASFQRRWGYHPNRTIYRWKNVIETARVDAEQCGANYMEVYYERLTRDPAAEMERVCRFLQLEFEQEVLSPSRKPRHMGSQADVITESKPRWQSQFDAKRIRSLENIAGQVLNNLGYSVQFVKGSADPSIHRLRYWALLDYSRRISAVVWDDLTRPKKHKWDSLGGRIGRAIRQKFTSKI